MTTNKDRELGREMWKWQRWRAHHNMRPSWRAGFLILVAGLALKVHWLLITMVLLGYQVCEFLDHLAKQRALDDIDAEEYGWQPDPDDPDSEINENGSARVKLPPEHQVIVSRISDRLRRMLL